MAESVHWQVACLLRCLVAGLKILDHAQLIEGQRRTDSLIAHAALRAHVTESHFD